MGSLLSLEHLLWESQPCSVATMLGRSYRHCCWQPRLSLAFSIPGRSPDTWTHQPTHQLNTTQRRLLTPYIAISCQAWDLSEFPTNRIVRYKKMICFKPLDFGVFCYVVVENHNTFLLGSDTFNARNSVVLIFISVQPPLSPGTHTGKDSSLEESLDSQVCDSKSGVFNLGCTLETEVF